MGSSSDPPGACITPSRVVWVIAISSLIAESIHHAGRRGIVENPRHRPQDFGRPPEHTKALAALGRGLRRARRPRESREPLRQALESAAACGGGGLTELYVTPKTIELHLSNTYRELADALAAG